jgi:hypothetical protein
MRIRLKNGSIDSDGFVINEQKLSFPLTFTLRRTSSLSYRRLRHLTVRERLLELRAASGERRGASCAVKRTEPNKTMRRRQRRSADRCDRGRTKQITRMCSMRFLKDLDLREHEITTRRVILLVRFNPNCRSTKMDHECITKAITARVSMSHSGMSRQNPVKS